MKTQLSSGNPSTLEEWTSFLRDFNGSKNSGMTLLKKTESANRIVMHLEKQFSKAEEQPIFRRLGRHTQLVIRFS